MTNDQRILAIRTALIERKHDRMTEHEFEQAVYEIVSPDADHLLPVEIAATIDPNPSTLIEHNPEQPVPLLPAPVDRDAN